IPSLFSKVIPSRSWGKGPPSWISSRVSRPSGGSSEAGTVASPESGVDPAEALLEVSGGFGPRPIPRGSPPVSRIHATTSRRKTPPPIRIHRRHPRGSGRDADILRLEVL